MTGIILGYFCSCCGNSWYLFSSNNYFSYRDCPNCGSKVVEKSLEFKKKNLKKKKVI